MTNPLAALTTDELRSRVKANAAQGDPPGLEMIELARRMTPDEVFQVSVRAGVHNPDGTLTTRFGGKYDQEHDNG